MNVSRARCAACWMVPLFWFSLRDRCNQQGRREREREREGREGGWSGGRRERAREGERHGGIEGGWGLVRCEDGVERDGSGKGASSPTASPPALCGGSLSRRWWGSSFE